MYGGLEGGATNSTFRIFDKHGTLLAEAVGQGTNLALMGVEKVSTAVYKLVQRAFEDSNLQGKSMESLGIALSGAESGSKLGQDLECRLSGLLSPRYLRGNDAGNTNLHVISDLEGSVHAATPNSAIVLIAGTGSNCIFVNRKTFTDDVCDQALQFSTLAKCGGGGHLIGDEGSAIYVALLALRVLMQAREGRTDFLTAHNLEIGGIKRLEQCTFEHFDLSSSKFLKSEMYKILYRVDRDVMKTKVAGLTKSLARIALEDDDALAKAIFKIAGKELGEMVNAVLHRSRGSIVTNLQENNLMINPEMLDVVCIGSMFKSWKLLKASFINTICQSSVGWQQQRLSRLLYVNDSSAIGAARYAAERGRTQVTLPLCKNIDILHTFRGQNENARRGSSDNTLRTRRRYNRIFGMASLVLVYVCQYFLTP